MFNRISQLLKWGVARFAESNGARLVRPDGTVLSSPYVLSFPDFSPSILASFVAGTTASQSGNTVTVTAPAHGIVGTTEKNGRRIYYPGSPSIPSGWYSGFAWIDANTITFQRDTTANVATESVNGGAAYVSVTNVCSLNLPGNSMGAQGRISLVTLRSGDAAVAAKFLRLVLGGTVLHGISVGTVANSEGRQTVRNTSASSQVSSAVADGSASGAKVTLGAVNTSVDQPVTVTLAVNAAGGWLCLEACELEVLYK